jgi:transketolase-like protein
VRIEVHPDEKAERSRVCDVDFSLSRILGVSGFGVDTCPSGRARTARVHREVGDATMSAATSAAVQPARPMTDAQLDQLSINCIRALSMDDAVQQAKSGHPGTPMGLAPLVYTLWASCVSPRDRFVLSNGHASMLAVVGATHRHPSSECCVRTAWATSSFRSGAGIDLWLGTLR